MTGYNDVAIEKWNIFGLARLNATRMRQNVPKSDSLSFWWVLFSDLWIFSMVWA